MTSFTAPDYELLEPGVYTAELTGTEERTNDDGHPYVVWKFAVEYDGREVSVSGATSTKFGPKAKARAWAEALLGRSIERGETVEIDDLVGRTCQLVLTIIKKDDAEYNRIDNLMRLRKNGQAKYDPDGEPLE